MNSRDLNAIFVWALAALLIATTTDIAVVRVLVSLPLVLFLVGYAVLRAFAVTPQAFLTHSVYSIGASIAITLAGGFLLNLVSGLTPFGWGCWFVLVTGVAAIIGRHRAFPWQFGPLPRVGRAPAVMAGITSLIVIGAFWQAVRDEADVRQFSFTEFWMLPKPYGKLTIGIHNAEHRQQPFDVEVTSVPDSPDDKTTGRVIAEWHGIMLNPGDDWTREVDFPPTVGYSKTQAILYLSQDHTIYRRVSAITDGK